MKKGIHMDGFKFACLRLSIRAPSFGPNSITGFLENAK